MLRSAATTNGGGPQVFCNDFGLSSMLLLQRLAGRMTAHETRRWRAWHAKNRGASIDPARIPGDPLPAFADVVAQVYGYARHPRAFVRKILLDKTSSA
jgi:D-aspartate ligase